VPNWIAPQHPGRPAWPSISCLKRPGAGTLAGLPAAGRLTFITLDPEQFGATREDVRLALEAENSQRTEVRGQRSGGEGMQIRSAKELIVYQKAYRLAMAGDRDQKSEVRGQ